MNENKKYEKKHINRAVEELTECLNNVLNARRDQYPQRIKQLFSAIKNNEILNFIIEPYINMKLDLEKENIGFRSTRHSLYLEFVITINEDEEIALILYILNFFADNEERINDLTYSVTMIDNFDESLLSFNKNYIEPAFNKLHRKLQYKLEDISEIQSNEIKAGDITIINIEKFHANNSMVAMGKEITQINENVFEKIKNEIQNNIENEKDKTELLSLVSEMEKNRANKEIFKSYYDKFINKLGIYMSIIGPLLPYLVEYFK